MTGAYTAKPGPGDDGYDPVPPVEIVPAPPGWDEDWDFPPDTPEGGSGPYPPGYDPEYSLTISGTGPVRASGGGAARYEPTSVVGAELFDHETYATAEPLGRPIVWSATIDGDAVVAPMTVYYIASGVYWGYDGDFDFELDIEHEGKTLVVTATSTVFGVEFAEEVEVEVYEPTYSISMSADSPVTVGDPVSAVVATLYDHDTYATKEPVDYELTFTATIDGVAVMTPRTVSYSDLGSDLWGHGSDFTFDLTTDHYDKTIILSVEGMIFGEVEVSDSVEIAVSGEPMPESFSGSILLNGYSWGEIPEHLFTTIQHKLRVSASGRGLDANSIRGSYPFDPPLGDENQESWTEVSSDTLGDAETTTDLPGKYMETSGTCFPGANYSMEHRVYGGTNATQSVTISMTINMSNGGGSYSDTKNLSLAEYQGAQYFSSAFATTGKVYIFGVLMN